MHRLPVESIRRKAILTALEERQRYDQTQQPVENYQSRVRIANGLQVGLDKFPLEAALGLFLPGGPLVSKLGAYAIKKTGQEGITRWQKYNRTLFMVEFKEALSLYEGTHDKETIFQRTLNKVPDELKLDLLVESRHLMAEAMRWQTAELNNVIAELHDYQTNHHDLKKAVAQQAQGNRHVARQVAQIYHMTEEACAYNRHLGKAIEGVGAYLNQRLDQHETTVSNEIRAFVHEITNGEGFTELKAKLDHAVHDIRQLRTEEQQRLFNEAKRERKQDENERFKQTLNGYAGSAQLLATIGQLSGNKSIALAGNVASIGVNIVAHCAELSSLIASSAGVAACAGPAAAIVLSVIAIHQLFTQSDGPSFEESVMTQLKQLSEQMQQLHKDMLTGFNALNTAIHELHLTVIESANHILHAIAYVRNDLGYLGHQIDTLRLDVSCLALQIENATEANEDNTYGRLVNDIITAERDPTATLYQHMSEDNYHLYRSNTAYLAKSVAKRAHHTGLLFQNYDAGTINNALTETTSSFKRLGYLNTYLRQVLNINSEIDSNLLAAPSPWLIGVSAYTIHRSRSLEEGMTFSFGDTLPIEEMRSLGENDVRFLKFVSNTPAIFNALFTHYEHAQETCQREIMTVMESLLASNTSFQTLFGYGYKLSKSPAELMKDANFMGHFKLDELADWRIDETTKENFFRSSNLIFHEYDGGSQRTGHMDFKQFKLDALHNKVSESFKLIPNEYKLAAMMAQGKFVTHYTLSEKTQCVKTEKSKTDLIKSGCKTGYHESTESIADKMKVEIFFRTNAGNLISVQTINANINSFDYQHSIYHGVDKFLGDHTFDHFTTDRQSGADYISQNIQNSHVVTTPDTNTVLISIEQFFTQHLTTAANSLSMNATISQALDKMDAQRRLLSAFIGLLKTPRAWLENSGLVNSSLVTKAFPKLQRSYVTEEFIRTNVMKAGNEHYQQLKQRITQLVAGNGDKYHPLVSSISDQLDTLLALKNQIRDYANMQDLVHAIDNNDFDAFIELTNRHPHLINFHLQSQSLLDRACRSSRYRMAYHLLKNPTLDISSPLRHINFSPNNHAQENYFLSFLLHNREQILRMLADTVHGPNHDIFYQFIALCAEQNKVKLAAFFEAHRTTCQTILERMNVVWQFILRVGNPDCLHYLISQLPDPEMFFWQHPDLIYQVILEDRNGDIANVLLERGADLNLPHALREEAMQDDKWFNLNQTASHLHHNYLIRQRPQKDLHAIYKNKHLHVTRPRYTLTNFAPLPIEHASLLRSLRFGQLPNVAVKLAENPQFFTIINSVGDNLLMLAIEVMEDDPTHPLYLQLKDQIDAGQAGELNWNAIFVACREGKFNLLDNLLADYTFEHRERQVQLADQLQQTPLQIAIRSRQVTSARALIEAGAMDTLPADQLQLLLTNTQAHPELNTLIHDQLRLRRHGRVFWAIRSDAIANVRRLFDQEPDLDLTATDALGQSFLLRAAMRLDDADYIDEFITALSKFPKEKIRAMLMAHTEKTFATLLQTIHPHAVPIIQAIAGLIMELGDMDHLLAPVRHLLIHRNTEQAREEAHESANMAEELHANGEQQFNATQGITEQLGQANAAANEQMANLDLRNQHLAELLQHLRNNLTQQYNPQP